MAQPPEDDGDDAKLKLPSIGIFRRRTRNPAPASQDTPTDITGTPSTGPSGSSPNPADETAEPLAELGSEADEPDVGAPAEDLYDESPAAVQDTTAVAEEQSVGPEPHDEPGAAAETPVEFEAPPATMVEDEPAAGREAT